METLPGHGPIEAAEIPTQGSEYRLLSNPDEVLEVWGDALDHTGDGDIAWFRTMRCSQGKVMKRLEPKLKEAVGRNVDVRLLYDPNSLLESAGLPSFARHFPVPGAGTIDREYRQNSALLRRLDEAGVRLQHTSSDSIRRHLMPFTGSDHIKGTIIGNKLWFGDKNLEDETFIRRRGFVVEIPNPEIVEALTPIIGDLATEKPGPIESEPETQIIWDLGSPGQSEIYEAALEIIENEGGFVGTATQFFPEGRFYQALKEAKARRARVEISTSKPDVLGNSPYYLINGITGKKIRWDTNSLPQAAARELFLGHGQGYQRIGDLRMRLAPSGIHAKYVVTPTEVEFGTCNHSEYGIRAGTAELAIRSTNPQLVKEVRRFHDELYEELAA